MAVAGVAIAGRTAQPTTKDARFINCYTHRETDPITEESRFYCVKRSGWATLNTPRAGTIGNAILVWTGQGTGLKVITAFGGTNSSIYDGTTRLTTDAADTTQITGLATGITETTLSGTATLVISSSDNEGWYYQDGGTVTNISDAQFPGNASRTLAGTFAHLDGYAFIMDTRGDIWNSDVNSVSSWGANSLIPAATYPDAGIACVRWKHLIVGFGTESMEFFRNAGNATGSPLSRITEMALKVGAVSADAIGQISDTLFFVGSTPQGGLTVFQFDGKLSRISTPEIDAILLLSGAGNIRVTTLRDAGLNFVIVSGSGLTYVYLMEDQFWFQWNGPNVLWTKCAGASRGTAQVSYAISSLWAGGQVFQINPSSRTFQDGGGTYRATIQLQTVDPGAGAFVTYDEAQLKADVESSTSEVSLSWSDDDYGTFSTVRTLDLSGNLPKTTRMGGTKNPRAYLLEHSANTPFRIEELRLKVTVGH